MIFSRNPGSLIKAGSYVISRGDRSGVFAGVLQKKVGSEVILTSARWIWYWSGASSLSELSQKGVSRPYQCKFPMEIPEVIQLDCVQLFPVTDLARKSIESVPVWTQHQDAENYGEGCGVSSGAGDEDGEGFGSGNASGSGYCSTEGAGTGYGAAPGEGHGNGDGAG